MYFALWVFAGASLIASTWFLTYATIAPGWPRGLAFGIPTAIGLAVDSWGIKRLNEESWSEEEVAPVEAVLENPFLKLVTVVLAFAALLPYAFHGHQAGASMLVFPSLAVISMQRLVARRKKRDGEPLDWCSFKPIQSDHWGKLSR